MTAHTISGFIYRVTYEFCDAVDVKFYPSDTMGNHSPNWHLVGPHEFTVELADDFNPVAAKIGAAEKERDMIRAKFAQDIATINERISKLSALTYEAPEAVEP